MKQIAIKLKNNTRAITYRSDFRRKMLNSIFVALGVLALAYVIIIGTITFNIIDRKSAESQSRILSARVGELELSYLSTYKSIDISASSELGFVEIKPEFATRSSLGSTALSGDRKKIVKNEI